MRNFLKHSLGFSACYRAFSIFLWLLFVRCFLNGFPWSLCAIEHTVYNSILHSSAIPISHSLLAQFFSELVLTLIVH